MAGSLTIVGTGLQLGQISMEAASHIREADKVFYLVTDPVTSDWIEGLNQEFEQLNNCYSVEKPRLDSYLEMVDRILTPVRAGLSVCAVFYGHPGVFVLPSHVAIRRARSEGFKAKMLPGVSAEDCLFCDLGVDPGVEGCSSYEGTDFLVNRRSFDIGSHLIIWQIGVIGDIGYKIVYDRRGLSVLRDRLLEVYPPDHLVTIYEAARYVVCEPSIQKLSLSDLISGVVSPISTLYVPPARKNEPDEGVMCSIGYPASYFFSKREATERYLRS